jgi:hypothetical protein
VTTHRNTASVVFRGPEEKGIPFLLFRVDGRGKTGIGKAGVALLCKEKPERVWFGVGDEEKDLSSRV